MSDKNNELFWGDSRKAAAQEHKGIEEVANRIYLYSKIDESVALQLNRTFAEMTINHLQDQLTRQLENPDPIFLHINSPGGILYDALSILEAMTQTKAKGIKIHTIVDGYAASAATLLIMMGDVRQMGKYSYMLIHELSAAEVGKYSEFQDKMYNLDILMEQVKGIYRDHASIPAPKLKELLGRDVVLNAETCLKYKMVDEIV